MTRGFLVRMACAATILTLASYLSNSNAQPVSEVEVTADGLHRVDPSILQNAWLRPEADLSRYTHVFVMPTVVLFRDVPEPSKSSWANSARTTFPVDDEMQERLRETFGQSFYEAMSASPDYEVSDRLGRNILLVRGYVTDVATGLPPKLAGTSIDAIRWIWEGNLVLELRDSMSDEVLLRILDRRRVEGPVEAERVWSLAPRVTLQWSRLMVDQLSTMADFYPSRLQRLQDRAQGLID